jgi:hypothetical protein
VGLKYFLHRVLIISLKENPILTLTLNIFPAESEHSIGFIHSFIHSILFVRFCSFDFVRSIVRLDAIIVDSGDQRKEKPSIVDVRETHRTARIQSVMPSKGNIAKERRRAAL